MTPEKECRLNKCGYCKFGNYCFRYHENKICQNVKCPVQGCFLRHPRKCRFFLEFGKCKFGTYCKFSHDNITNMKNSEEIDEIRNEMKKVKSKIKEKEVEIKLKDEEIKIFKLNPNKQLFNWRRRIKNLQTF